MEKLHPGSYFTKHKSKSATPGKTGKKGIPVYQFDLEGKFIASYTNATEAGKQLKISNSSISSNCKGKQNTAGGFIWRLTREPPAEKSVEQKSAGSD